MVSRSQTVRPKGVYYSPHQQEKASIKHLLIALGFYMGLCAIIVFVVYLLSLIMGKPTLPSSDNAGRRYTNYSEPPDPEPDYRWYPD